jgi:hypothetical protein
MADTKTPVSKSEFIRSQSTEKTAKQVVAEAKARGMKFDEAYVYKIRRTASLKKVTTPKKTSTAPPSAAANKSSTVSKADFVRARPTVSPKGIVEQAAAAGIKLGIRYVYNVRGSDKASRKEKPASTVVSLAKKPTSPAAPIVKAVSSSAEVLLRAVAAELGLGRAIDLLQGERARVQSILKG